MSSVMVDIEAALEILKQIDAAAEKYLGYQQAAQELADDLQACWEGTSGRIVHEKAIVIKAQQKKIGNKILNASNEIRKKLMQLADADASLASSITHYSGGGRRG